MVISFESISVSKNMVLYELSKCDTSCILDNREYSLFMFGKDAIYISPTLKNFDIKLYAHIDNSVYTKIIFEHKSSYGRNGFIEFKNKLDFCKWKLQFSN